MNFDSILNQIKERAANTSALGSTLKFDFGDQQIFLDGSGVENAVSTENKEADCIVSIQMKDLAAILGGNLNPMAAFMTGKIKVKGNMGVAMKLQSLLA